MVSLSFKVTLLITTLTASLALAEGGKPNPLFQPPRSELLESGDYRVLQYVIPGFDELPLSRRIFLYYLAQAMEVSNDIAWKQSTRNGLQIREVLNAVWEHRHRVLNSKQQKALTEYLFKLYSNHGNYEVYANRKFILADFATETGSAIQNLLTAVTRIESLQPQKYKNLVAKTSHLIPDIFDPLYRAVYHAGEGADLISDSNTGFYGEGVYKKDLVQAEATAAAGYNPFVSYPQMNATKLDLTKRSTGISGRFGDEIRSVIQFMEKAKIYGNPAEQKLLTAYIQFFRTGSAQDMKQAEILWIQYRQEVDFMINFIEVYEDPLAVRGTWSGMMFLRAIDSVTATRNENIRKNADYFEAAMPVDTAFKKAPGFTPPTTEGAYFIASAGASGEKPFSGVNLPNDTDLRATHGSKSYTMLNVLFDLNGPKGDKKLLAKYHPSYHEKMAIFDMDLSRVVQVEFHEILGHGSGQYAPGKSNLDIQDLGTHLEEARAELASLYHMTDPKLIELGILPSVKPENLEDFARLSVSTFFTAQLWSYAIRLKDDTTAIKQAHQLGRQVMLNWMLEHGAIDITTAENGLPVVLVPDVSKARETLGALWAIVQKNTSLGLYEATKTLFEQKGFYGDIHKGWRAQILKYLESKPTPKQRLYLNPPFVVDRSEDGRIKNVRLQYHSPFGLTLEKVIEKQVRRATGQKTLLKKTCAEALTWAPTPLPESLRQ